MDGTSSIDLYTFHDDGDPGKPYSCISKEHQNFAASDTWSSKLVLPILYNSSQMLLN